VKIEDFDQHVDQDLISQANEALGAITGRRKVAAERVAAAEAGHTAAQATYKAALAGGDDLDPHEARQALDGAATRVQTARDSVQAVEAAIQAAELNHLAAIGKAHTPRYDAAVAAIIEATRRGDAAREALKEAKTDFQTCIRVIASAVAHKARWRHSSLLDGGSPSLTGHDGVWTMPTEAEMTKRFTPV